MSQARRHRLFRARQQSAHKKLARRSLFEQLEARQLMASDLANVHLIDDTQTPADLISSDSRIGGTVTFSNASYVTVEFDDNGDGTPESSRRVDSSGGSFTFDPQWHNSSLRDGTYGGAYLGSPMQVDFQMRLKEYDGSNALLATSSWQTFPFTLQPEGQPQFSLTDYGNYTTVSSGGAINLGTANVGATVERNFYLANYGYGRLTLDTSSISLPAGFTFDSALPGHLDAYGGVYFSIRFTPSAVGNYGGQVLIRNNDNNQPAFTFTLAGQGAILAPEIDVKDGITSLVSGTSNVNFGSASMGGSLVHTFTIANTGNSPLVIDPYSISYPSGFWIYSYPDSMLEAGSSTSLAIAADTMSPDTYSGTLSIPSNDGNESPFTFTISATVNDLPAEIDFRNEGVSLPSNSGTLSFGSTPAGTPLQKYLTISNTGQGTLVLNTSSLILPSGFTLQGSLPESIGPGSDVYLPIEFHSSTAGNYSGYFELASNDGDESPYRVQLVAAATELTPEIEILDPNGYPLASGSGSVAFGTVNLNEPHSYSFQVNNTGTGWLSLGEISVPNGFTLTSSPGNSVPPGSFTSFTLQLSANAAGSFSGTVSIPNNRVAGRVAPPSPHTTVHAGPHTAVQRRGASCSQSDFSDTSPWACSQAFVRPTPVAMLLARCHGPFRLRACRIA